MRKSNRQRERKTCWVTEAAQAESESAILQRTQQLNFLKKFVSYKFIFSSFLFYPFSFTVNSPASGIDFGVWGEAVVPVPNPGMENRDAHRPAVPGAGLSKEVSRPQNPEPHEETLRVIFANELVHNLGVMDLLTYNYPFDKGALQSASAASNTCQGSALGHPGCPLSPALSPLIFKRSWRNAL